MTERNETTISEFLILGLPNQSEQQHLFYVLFLAMYLVTVLGNLLIIVLILLDSHLHTPMYLFLSNLSLSDLCFSSKLLQNMQNQVPSIPYAGCLTQVYIFLFFADLESFLLVVMAYDCYVAICFPLHYTSIMSFLLVVMAYDRYVVICFPLHYTSIRSPKLCVCLVVLSWVLTTFHAMLHTLLMARLSFCENNVIPHFFCDLSALVKLTCSDTHVNEFVMLVMGALIGVISFLLIIMSYARIVSSILKVLATQGIHKIFSTCGSHLCVVSLFYGTSGTLYLSPSTNNFVVKEIVMAVMYMVVTPMLNPFIYSLRNRDMNDTLRRVLCL